MGLFNVKGRVPKSLFRMREAAPRFAQAAIKARKSGRRHLIAGRSKTACVERLEVQFQSELKLTRIKGRRGPAVITAVTCALMESIHIVNKW